MQLPSKPVLTHSGAWFKAAESYHRNYDTLEKTVNVLPAIDARSSIAEETAEGIGTQTRFGIRTCQQHLFGTLWKQTGVFRKCGV
jgi:hypothetical protein